MSHRNRPRPNPVAAGLITAIAAFMWAPLALAQSSDASDDHSIPASDSDEQPASKWGLGGAVGAFNSPYAGEGTRVVPYPLISYEGKHFYFRGITAGWNLWETGGLSVSAITEPRLDGFDVSDLGRTELARNGIDYRLLEDRDKGASVGFRALWGGDFGELEIKALADVTNASGGHDDSIQYGYPIQLWKGILTPVAGVTWLSKDASNYFFGTLDEEVERGVVDYKPGAAAIPRVGLSYFRPLGKNWSLIENIDYSMLPDEIRNSPLVDPGTNGTLSVFIGFSRGFVPWWMNDR